MSKELEDANKFLVGFITGVDIYCDPLDDDSNNSTTEITYNQAQALLSELNRTCEWVRSDHYHGWRDTECGIKGYQTLQSPRHTWCQFCGGKIEVHNVQN